MSVHNGEAYLSESIESILSQTLADFEFIIVDDGSTDRTPMLLANYGVSDRRIILIRNDVNIGLAASLNEGLALATGEFVARQDGDDVSLPERLHAQAKFLSTNPDVGMIGSNYIEFNTAGDLGRKVNHPATDLSIRWQMLFHNAFAHPTVMFRRETLASAGRPYDTSLSYSQDYELWTRMLKRTFAANLQEYLVLYRIHDDMATKRFSREQRANALSISTEQIRSLDLDFEVPDSDVQTFRRWYAERPSRCGREQLRTCIGLLKIYVAFTKSVQASPTSVQEVGLHLTGRTLSSHNGTISQWLVWSLIRAFGTVARVDPEAVLARGVRRILMGPEKRAATLRGNLAP